MQVNRVGEKRIRPGEAPLPPRNKFGTSRVPETLVYDYPEQLYIYTYKSGRNTESLVVKKMGDRTIRQEGTSVDRVISQQEYDALEPLNGPDRMGRFDSDEGYGPIQRRDFALEQAMQIVAANGMLNPSDILKLATTNQTLAVRMISDSKESFLSAEQAIMLLGEAISENNLYILKLGLDANIILKQAQEFKETLYKRLLLVCLTFNYDPPGYSGVRESVQIIMTHPSTREFHNRPELDLQDVYEACVGQTFATLKYIFQYTRNPQFLRTALLDYSKGLNNEDKIEYLVDNGAPIASVVRPEHNKLIYNLIKNYGRKTYVLISRCLRGRSNDERMVFLDAEDQLYKCPITRALQFEKWDIVKFLLKEALNNYGYTLAQYNANIWRRNFLQNYAYFLLSIAIHSEYRLSGEIKTCEAPPDIVLDILNAIFVYRLNSGEISSIPPPVEIINQFGTINDRITDGGHAHPLFYCPFRKDGGEIIAAKLFSMGTNPIYLMNATQDKVVNPFFQALRSAKNVRLIETYCTYEFPDNNWVGDMENRFNNKYYVRGKLDINKIRAKGQMMKNNVKFYSNALIQAMSNTTPERNRIVKYLVEHKFAHLNQVTDSLLPTGRTDDSGNPRTVKGTATELDVLDYNPNDDDVETSDQQRHDNTDVFMFLVHNGARFTNYRSVAYYAIQHLARDRKVDGNWFYEVATDQEFQPFDFIYSRSSSKTQQKMLWTILNQCLRYADYHLNLFEHMRKKYKFDVNYYEEDNRDRDIHVHDSEGYVDEFYGTQPLLNHVLENASDEPINTMKKVQELLDEGASTRIKCTSSDGSRKDALDLAMEYQQEAAAQLTVESSGERDEEVIEAVSQRFMEASAIVKLIQMHRLTDQKA